MPDFLLSLLSDYLFLHYAVIIVPWVIMMKNNLFNSPRFELFPIVKTFISYDCLEQMLDQFISLLILLGVANVNPCSIQRETNNFLALCYQFLY